MPRRKLRAPQSIASSRAPKRLFHRNCNVTTTKTSSIPSSRQPFGNASPIPIIATNAPARTSHPPRKACRRPARCRQHHNGAAGPPLGAHLSGLFASRYVGCLNMRQMYSMLTDARLLQHTPGLHPHRSRLPHNPLPAPDRPPNNAAALARDPSPLPLDTTNAPPEPPLASPRPTKHKKPPPGALCRNRLPHELPDRRRPAQRRPARAHPRRPPRRLRRLSR